MNTKSTYTINQLAKLAGVTRRTLHYYDEVGLLRPEAYGDNGYRYYGEQAALRLQQILFYRELGLSLEQVKAALNRPDFDLEAALQGHKRALLERAERLMRLVDTVEKTLLHLRGEIEMSQKDFYSGFDEAQQKAHEQEARRRWGSDQVDESSKRWASYSREQKNAILAENHEITLGIAANMEKGHASPEVQGWIDRWYRAINAHFYTCSLDVFEALGHGYVEDPAFTATYEAIRVGLAAFMEQAMTHYCQVQRGK